MNTFKTSYPVLPLIDMVVFPTTEASLFVGRNKSIEAIQRAMASDRKIVLITQKQTEVLFPKETDLFKIGVMCEILQLLKMPDHTYKVLVEGLHRIKLISLREEDSVNICEVKILKTSWESVNDKLKKQDLEKKIEKLKKLFFQYNEYWKVISSNSFQNIINHKNVEELLDFIAHNLDTTFKIKQKILSSLDIMERAILLIFSLENQKELNELGQDINNKIRQKIDKAQKEYYFNEQIRMIRSELGDEELNEVENYQKKAKDKKLPQRVMEYFNKEVSRIEKMPPISAEATVVRNYLDWILKLPWNKISKDVTDIKKAEIKLDVSHFGIKKVKERILEYIAVKKLSNFKKSPILCFLGPPGVGKTSLARSFAECLNRKFVRISLGGIRDEAEIRGHRKTYIGAMPGRIITALSRVGTKNPVILLDEIDKVSSDYRGNPAAALLEVLDPEQNFEFDDHYLEIPFDLSQVLFIATANTTHTIPDVLIDRLEVLEVRSYTEEEKIQISKIHLIKKQLSENGLKKNNLEYNDDSFSYIIRHYTKEAGVRSLDRKLSEICRKIARQIVENDEPNKVVNLRREVIENFLRAPKYDYGKKELFPVIGKCNGLAWTSTGGDILSIEALFSFGSGKISITGNLGDIMKESVNIAVGYVRSRSHLLSLSSDFFDKTNIYVHVPEGSIPKDGPSAGAAITLCLISALLQKPIQNDIALTGEITLRGLILPIGGLREKVLGAFRGGIQKIICPAKNKKDMEDIPADILSKMQFYFVNNFEEIIDQVFQNSQTIFKKVSNQYSFESSHLTDVVQSSRITPS